MSYFIFILTQSHMKVTKDATANTGCKTWGGKKAGVQCVFCDFHILQAIMVKQRTVIKFSVRLNSNYQ